MSSRYINPIARYLRRTFTRVVDDQDNEERQKQTKCEILDQVQFIISFDEAQWLSNTLWLSFVSKIQSLLPSYSNHQSNEEGALNPNQVMSEVNQTNLALIEENLHILEQFLSFSLVQDLMIEHDMIE